MNLKEKLKKKQTELMNLKSKIEEGDADAIKQSEELVKEIGCLEEQIKAADEAMAKLQQLGEKRSDEPEGDANETKAKSLGENFVKALKSNMPQKGQRFTVSAPEYKENSDVLKVPSSVAPAIATIDRNIVTAARTNLVIRDLFGAEQISGNALIYFVEGAFEGDFDVVAEGNKMPQVSIKEPKQKTETLSKIAAFLKESDEYREDVAFLASTINGRLLYQLALREQSWLINKLLNTSGIQTGDIDIDNDATFIADQILQAMADVEKHGGFAADAVSINPAIWMKLRIGKDAQGRYYGGGYFTDPTTEGIWGLKTVSTSAVKGAIIGAYKPSASVISKGGVHVEMTNSDQDDFEKNLMTIRAEERLGLAVRRPAGFKALSFSRYTKGESGDKAAEGVTYYKKSGKSGEYIYTSIPASEITVGTTDVYKGSRKDACRIGEKKKSRT